MHTNIDCAIASVIELGQDLSISNVFAAYLQSITAHRPSDPVSTDTDAIALAALVSFERAMDKYPMPSLATKTRTKSKKRSKLEPPTDTPAPVAAVAIKTKIYSAEVAQLRWDYQKAIWRDYGDRGCTCLSCGTLLSLREQAALLAEKVEDLEQQLVNLPEPKRRTRKVKRGGSKKASSPHVVPRDPYAPSTSAAAI